MKPLLAIAGLGIKQNIKSPLISGLLVLAPIMLIFVIGESFRNVLPAEDPYGHITLIVLVQAIAHSSSIGFWGMQKQIHHHTIGRISTAPITPFTYVVGGFASAFISIIIFLLAVTIGAAAFLGVSPGPAPGALFVVIICGSMFSAALGTLIGSASTEGRSAAGIMSGGIPILIMLGGAYFPIPEKGPLAIISPYTPYRWINDALTNLLASAPSFTVWRTTLLCIPAATVLIFLAIVIIQRRWK